MVESLLSYQKVLRRELLLRQAAATRSPKPVTMGSYYRTVQQGKAKIKESFLTVIISIWLGFVGKEDLRRLLDGVGKELPELGEDEVDRLISVTQALVDRIVMSK